ncbi:Crp/Fnr family transcriptional regulator [Paenibacillus xanthanilyticus]|uniref:Crp/Fnr family transcriptional regulator n=1 Tax=Paenibacillus xanthanilyticus TaxID=1783531 RepID=A0ABV8JZ64_9BACL
MESKTEEAGGGLLRTLSVENFEKLRGIMYISKAEKGSYLFREGEIADKLYYLFQGQVRTTKSSDVGRTLTLYLHQAGDLLGQVDPFQDGVHGFSAEVTENASIGTLQRKDVEVLVWQDGDFALEWMRWMGLMHRLTQTKFRDLMLFGKTGALCSLLIRLCNSYGKTDEGKIEINLKISNTEMADMIGATRESVNRMLSELRKKGVIDYANGYYVVHDLEYLREICHCDNCPKEICRM